MLGAYQTLRLRHFFRSFSPGMAPEAYYRYLDGSIDSVELFASNPTASYHAEKTALHVTLGPENHDIVRKIIAERLANASLWVLVGGPPCQAYSLAGRSRMQSMPEFEHDERHFLYKEYLRVIAEHRPPVFVMENVKGLLSARHNGKSMIQMICKDLRNPYIALGISGNRPLKYQLYGLCCSSTLLRDIKPRDLLVRSELHGVPQARHRVFALGIRSDLDIQPSQLKTEDPPTVEQTIGQLPKIRSGITDEPDTPEAWRKAIAALGRIDFKGHPLAEAITMKVNSLFEFTSDQLEREATFYPLQPAAGTGGAMESMYDPRVQLLNGHDSRAHMKADLQRYAFATAFAQMTGKSPKLSDFPTPLLPNHRDIEDGRTVKKFVDRFKVQLPDRTASTITAHIAKDGHYYIHYDLAQCRSLTVREAARLQTFPDNYKFEGPRTEQYRQIGNAVPPYLARQIGDVVADVLDIARERM